MSEIAIRSPFAIIAEIASVVAVFFYLYAYLFFHGFMFNLDYQFLTLFSLTNVTDYLAWSLIIYIGFFGLSFASGVATIGFVALMIENTPRFFMKNARRYIFFTCLIALFMPLLLIHRVNHGLDPFMGKAVFVEIATLISYDYVAIIIIIWSAFGNYKYKKFGRPFAYLFIAIGLGINAHSSGSGFLRFLRNERKQYCVEGANESFSATLLIASDQSALFEKKDGEILVLPFNALKKISNKPC